MFRSGKRFLFIFDFDHTIVNLNTDTYIQRVLPNKQLPEDVILIANTSLQTLIIFQYKDWNRFVQASLNYIQDQHISIQQLKDCLQTMQLTPGFDKIFQFMKKNQSEVDGVIVSDSNKFFIESILEKYELQQIFKHILTNPTEIDQNTQRITLGQFHSHNCSRKTCPPNLCKNIALKNALNWEQSVKGNYEGIYYFGDGGNDFCPLSLLRKNDVVFARKDFKLDEVLSKNQVECQTFLWENGNQIIQSQHFQMIEKQN